MSQVKVKRKLFRSCREKRHKDCMKEFVKNGVRFVCTCSHHLREPQKRIPATYRLIFAECGAGLHNLCRGELENKATNSKYICKCPHHKADAS